MSTEIEYTLEVYGIAWSGWKAVSSYSLSPWEAATILSGRPVESAARDFRSVLDWRLVRCAYEYEARPGGLNFRVDSYRTLRGFRAGMRPARFYRMANGGRND